MLHIADFLLVGEENARPGHELAKMMNIKRRDFDRLIQAERRAGVPICASVNPSRPGFYLGTDEDVKRFCESLFRRAKETKRTGNAMLRARRTASEK